MSSNLTRGRLARPLLLLLLVGVVTSAHGRGTYQTPQAFIAEAFAGEPPTAQKIWLSGELGKSYREVMQEPPPQLRLRYWQQGTRSVWILQAIGKEHPITAGFTVDNGRIVQTRVLIFRESRGWEIRHPFFTRQFKQVGLNEGKELDSHIDTITGATLSVRAMTNMARMALLLAEQVTPSHDTP